MISKYYGFCVVCKCKILPGDDIQKNPDTGKWNMHTNCSEAKADHKAAFLEKRSAKPWKGDDFNLAEAVAEAENNTVEEAAEHYQPVANFVASPYQQAIFEFIVAGQGNAVIEAVAGSGKTTTIVKALALTNPKDKVAFLAFNKHIATELKRRCPEHVHVSTLHSLGYSLIRSCYGNVEVDEDKVGKAMDPIWPVAKYRKAADGGDLLVHNQKVEVPNKERTANRQKRSIMRKIVALAKATLVNYESRNTVEDMVERYNIDAGTDLDELIDKLPIIMDACRNADVIDYDDMIWLPVVDKRMALQTQKFNWLFVDEAQDLNKCQIEFLKNSLAYNGRVIAVGDRKQSLYGFRGADVDAIPNMIAMLNAKVLPLSISYRCPKQIVMAAKEIVPQIEYSDTADEGEIIPIKYEDFMKEMQPGDMVICRTNAPLVKPAFEVIRSGTKAIIRGKDIGRSLVTFIDRFQATDLYALEAMMEESTRKEVERLLDQGKELAADMSKDRLDTIITVSKECTTVQELVSKLEILFDDSNVGVVFSSVHRAKGLEANRIFVLHRELMPHPKAKAGWEVEQEQNTLYVAITRSKSKLYWVANEE